MVVWKYPPIKKAGFGGEGFLNSKGLFKRADISALLNNPLEFKKPSPPNPAFLIGGYFHTTILEPHKLDKYKIVKSSTRNTKAYKEIAGEDICLLEHEADNIELMREKVLDNDLFRDLIQEVQLNMSYLA